jgi:hypothetical protein
MIEIDGSLIMADPSKPFAESLIPTAPLMEAFKGNFDQASQAWTRNYEIYVQYLTTLSKARGPQEIAAANADFVAASIENMTKSIGALAKTGVMPPK